MKFRVEITVGYCEAYFEFEDMQEACSFMATAAEKNVPAGDRTSMVCMRAIEEPTGLKEE